MKKKILSLLLCFVMLFGTFSSLAVANAVGEGLDPNYIWIVGEDKTAKAGETIEMIVYITNNTTQDNDGLGGINFDIPVGYNSTAFTIDKIEDMTDPALELDFGYVAGNKYNTSYATGLDYGIMDETYAIAKLIITIGADTEPGVYDIGFRSILLTACDFSEPEGKGATNHITVVSDQPVHTHTEGKKVITTAPTETTEGEITTYCAECGEVMATTVLPVLSPLGFSMADTAAKVGETVTIPVYIQNPETGFWGTSFYAMWDKALGTDVTLTAGDVYGANAEFNSTAAKLPDVSFAGKMTAAGIDVDGIGKYVAGGSIWEKDGKITTESGVLFNINIALNPVIAVGTYEVSAIFYADLFTTIDGVYGEIPYNVNYDEDSIDDNRVVTATLTVGCDHATTENRNVVEATCTTDGSYDVVCTACGAVLETVTVPAAGHGETKEANRVEATCEVDGKYDLVCTVCNEVVETVVLPATGHTPGEWETTKEPTYDETGLREKKCTVCGKVLDTEVIPVLERVVLDLGLEPGYFADAAKCAIDNEARTINIVSKLDAATVDYRVVFPNADMKVTTTAENITVRQIVNGKVVTVSADVAETDTQWKYFEAKAENGYAQTYEIVVTADGEEYVYTVNVTFAHSPACTGVEPGWAANAALTGFDPENDHVINVVSKPGMATVDFRLLNMAKGSYARIADGTAYVVQWVVDRGEYVNVTRDGGETQTQWKYFTSEKADGAEQSYKIEVIFVDGSTETYTVNVRFVEK